MLERKAVVAVYLIPTELDTFEENAASSKSVLPELLNISSK